MNTENQPGRRAKIGLILAGLALAFLTVGPALYSVWVAQPQSEAPAVGVGKQVAVSAYAEAIQTAAAPVTAATPAATAGVASFSEEEAISFCADMYRQSAFRDISKEEAEAECRKVLDIGTGR